MFTLVHAFANYLFAVPIRKRIDIIAFMLASVLPDIEGLYYMPAAYAACGSDLACAAAYPSHYVLHSFLGMFLIIAPAALLISFYFRRYLKLSRIGVKIMYVSALFGGLLHLLGDVVFHTGADSLYLLWPLQTQYSFAFAGSEILWSAFAGLGVFAFILIEGPKIKQIIRTRA